MKLGILGGTFDPPHIGHLILAEEAQAQLKLDHVLWVLTPFPPHKKKQKITPLKDRLKMVVGAITDNPIFILSTVDINRPQPHYAVDTLQLLHDAAPNDELYYLMGADELNDLPTWHQPVVFLCRCKGIGVMMRHGETINIAQLEGEIPGLSAKLHYLKTPIIEISASDIRKRVEQGKNFRYFVPKAVFQYIIKNKLYLS
jgi:nicotinate-nucleotide adenylyltransferase